MKWFCGLALAALFAPSVALGQGLRMSEDFLPLAVGNRWTYNIVNDDGKGIGQIEFEVSDHKIVSGKSFYVISGFPFVEDGNQIHLVRYDRQTHEFVRVIDNDEGPLLLGDGATVEVIDKDSTGLPMKFVMHTDRMALTFQRGVGIIEARMESANGVQIAKINGARVGMGVASGGVGAPIGTSTNAGAAAQAPPPPQAPKTPEQRVKDLSVSVGKITSDNPHLEADVEVSPTGYKFVLTVTNTDDKLLPFSFTTSQKFDFVVIDEISGREIWRLSKQSFPSAVKLTEAIPPHAAWKFETSWNRRDSDFNPVPPGNYRLVAFVTTQPALQSEAVPFVVK